MRIPFILLLTLLQLAVHAQFTPGNSYFGDSSYVEYQAGNLPIIISAPHGGYLEPAAIPDRNCSGCVYVRDSYTQELSRETSAALLAANGCYPHVIINRLHRKKLDANRDIGDAADGDPLGEHAWREYQAFVDSAKAAVLRDYGRGIFLDMHGHGHTIQRIEVGYLISGNRLREPDDSLDTPTGSSLTSIKQLVLNNVGSLSHSELIRGAESFGSLLVDRGVPAVPSDADPFPMTGESYFSGGFNTARNGSRDSSFIDAIQLEHHQDIRFTSSIRKNYADSLAVVILDYVNRHYFPGLDSGACLLTSISPPEVLAEFQVYPNPSAGRIRLNHTALSGELLVHDQLGRLVDRRPLPPNGAEIDFSMLPNGRYLMTLRQAEAPPQRTSVFIFQP